MQHLIDAVHAALDQQNWYAALMTALTLPDICGDLEEPGSQSGQRYRAWFDRYLAERYVARGMPQPMPSPDGTRTMIVEADVVFLSALDCYVLRCAYLHNGSFDVTGQRKRDVLDGFIFVAPRPYVRQHCNRINDALQLQVDVFCRELTDGVKKWLDDVAGNAAVQQRMQAMAYIH